MFVSFLVLGLFQLNVVLPILRINLVLSVLKFLFTVLSVSSIPISQCFLVDLIVTSLNLSVLLEFLKVFNLTKFRSFFRLEFYFLCFKFTVIRLSIRVLSNLVFR